MGELKRRALMRHNLDLVRQYDQPAYSIGKDLAVDYAFTDFMISVIEQERKLAFTISGDGK